MIKIRKDKKTGEHLFEYDGKDVIAILVVIGIILIAVLVRDIMLFDIIHLIVDAFLIAEYVFVWLVVKANMIDD